MVWRWRRRTAALRRRRGRWLDAGEWRGRDALCRLQAGVDAAAALVQDGAQVRQLRVPLLHGSLLSLNMSRASASACGHRLRVGCESEKGRCADTVTISVT
jgi:hypothetical protein